MKMRDWTPGPWLVATSNSWRRIVSRDGRHVCEPITQNDGHPDLYFRNGGPEGIDARLLVGAPRLMSALCEIIDNDPYKCSSAGIIARAAIAEVLGES